MPCGAQTSGYDLRHNISIVSGWRGGWLCYSISSGTGREFTHKWSTDDSSRSVRVIAETILSELEAPEFTLVSDIHRQRCTELAPVIREEEALNGLISASKQFSGEVFVRPGGEWKAILAKSEAAQNAASVIMSMRDEIETLWADTAVRELLEKKDISLRDGGG